jgi:hypothetical protein
MEMSDYQRYIGTKAKDMIAKAKTDPAFAKLTDQEKADNIDAKLKDINSAAKIELFGNAPTKKAAVNSIIDTGYATAKTTDSSTSSTADKSFADQYKSAKDDYVKNQASYTPIARIKKEKDLKTLAVKKDFDKDTVDLYGMSKSEVYDYVSQNKDGKAQVEKLVKYGDAMVAAGLYTTNKFKDKYGNLALNAPKAKSSGGSKKTGKGSRGGKASASKMPTGLSAAMAASRGMKIPTIAKAPSSKSGAGSTPSYRKLALRKYSVSGGKIPQAPKITTRKAIA